MQPPSETTGTPEAATREALPETKVLADVLATLAGTAGQQSLSPHAGEDVVRDALRQVEDMDGGTWVEVLVQAGHGLGLTLTTLHRSPAEVVAQGPRQGPVATLVRQEDRFHWLLVEEWAPGRVWVRRSLPTLGATEGWMDAATLTRLVGGSEARPWVLAEPARPLETMKDESAKQGHTSPVARLKALLSLEGPDLWAVVVYAMGVGLFALATPIAVQALVNTMAFGSLLQPVVVLSLLLLGGLIFAAGLRAMKAWVVETIQQRLFIHVVSDLGHRLPRVHARAWDRTHGPELVNRFFDVVTLQKSTASLLLDGVSAVLQAGIGMLLLAFYHPMLLAFDVVLLAAVTAVILGYARSATHTSLYESKAKYAVGAWLQELVRHPVAFRGAERFDFALRHTDSLARKWLEARRKHYKYLFRQILGALGLQAVASALLLLLGGWLVIQRQLTLGQLVAAELIVTAVLVAVAKFGKHLETYYDLLSSLDKLGQLVDLPLEKEDGESQPPGSGPARLRLHEVGFAYEGGPQVLGGVSLELAPGTKATLTSDCAGGRSTLADLLFGLHTPSSGRILLGDVDVSDLKPDALRRQVALLKGPEVFAGSVLDNVRMGRTEVSRSDVRQVLEQVGLHEAILRLPEGLDTGLVTGGAPLSASQAVLLTLARTLLTPPRLLVLDGTLDTLDGAALERVLCLLLDKEAPWTLLLLTRREELLRRGEKRFALVGGRIQEATHASLRVLL